MYEPSEAEMEILDWIWKLQPVGVRDIFERIAAKKSVGYTTVLKQIQRLTEKGVIQKHIDDGGHRYTCNLDETTVKTQMAQKLLDSTFGGSALQFMQHALGQPEKSDLEELRALKQWLDAKIEKS